MNRYKAIDDTLAAAVDAIDAARLAGIEDNRTFVVAAARGALVSVRRLRAIPRGEGE